ncbi:MAG: hypothetical protein KGI75_17620 [Rhizobiaceae bacterium]|nr:hypothetical protein [Rhizobiaceae bacterium]
MSPFLQRLALIGLLALLPVTGLAAESDFLQYLQGRWNGSGTVVRRIGTAPINVNCSLTSTAKGPSLSMKGQCRGLLVVSRSISADITANGTRYTGVYVGPSGGRSALSGSRQGNTINLNVRWAKLVNGDHDATMTITRVGNNGLALQTIDRDPGTGKSLVTSDIKLQRQ